MRRLGRSRRWRGTSRSSLAGLNASLKLRAHEVFDMDRKEKVSVSLKVGEVKQQKDSGGNIARIDSETMKTIGITVGDVIEIIGKKSTAAKALLAYPEDEGRAIIRIDGFIRKNCDVAINEFVSVRKAEVKSARYIKLAPVDIRISVDSDLVHLIRDRLMDRTCVRRDTQPITIRGHYSIPFKVLETLPRGIMKTLQTTEIDILSEPSLTVEQQNESISYIQIIDYEDLENLNVSIGEVERIVNVITNELIIKCEVILSYRTIFKSIRVEYISRWDEATEWRNIIEKKEYVMETKLKDIKNRLMKLLEASDIPIKIDLSQTLREISDQVVERVSFDVFDIFGEGVRVLEKRKAPKEGLRLILSQKLTFPKPIKVWDLHSSKILEKTIFEVIYDASIPEEQYSSYEGFSVGNNSKGKILVLLACLGYSYPTTAISEATDVARSTTSRLLWELRRDSFVKGIPGKGVMHTEDDFYPYKYGSLRENHYMLTEKGIKEAERLIQNKVQAS